VNGWANFFLAEVGASAALAGLIFVGVSINLTKILSAQMLPNRAIQALLFLGTILVLSSLVLVPDQSMTLIGVEVMGIAIALWIFLTILGVRSWQQSGPEYRGRVIGNLILDQVVVLPYAIAGIVILMQGANGLYWLVPAILFSFAKSMVDAWILLVEINR
jgi:modulator of FtsH protease